MIHCDWILSGDNVSSLISWPTNIVPREYYDKTLCEKFNSCEWMNSFIHNSCERVIFLSEENIMVLNLICLRADMEMRWERAVLLASFSYLKEVVWPVNPSLKVLEVSPIYIYFCILVARQLYVQWVHHYTHLLPKIGIWNNTIIVFVFFTFLLALKWKFSKKLSTSYISLLFNLYYFKLSFYRVSLNISSSGEKK